MGTASWTVSFIKLLKSSTSPAAQNVWRLCLYPCTGSCCTPVSNTFKALLYLASPYLSSQISQYVPLHIIFSPPPLPSYSLKENTLCLFGNLSPLSGALSPNMYAVLLPSPPSHFNLKMPFQDIFGLDLNKLWTDLAVYSSPFNLCLHPYFLPSVGSLSCPFYIMSLQRAPGMPMALCKYWTTTTTIPIPITTTITITTTVKKKRQKKWILNSWPSLSCSWE